jgi:purine-binding chemotaxis protein CheW
VTIMDRACTEFVTARVGDQWFGFAIDRVRDVFTPDNVTGVPLAPPEIAGLINLRGRIVTLIDLHSRLGHPPSQREARRMAIGIDHRGESFGLLIDRVGEVASAPAGGWEKPPANLDPRWSSLVTGVARLDDRLMLAFDIDRMLDERLPALAA